MTTGAPEPPGHLRGGPAAARRGGGAPRERRRGPRGGGRALRARAGLPGGRAASAWPPLRSRIEELTAEGLPPAAGCPATEVRPAVLSVLAGGASARGARGRARSSRGAPGSRRRRRWRTRAGGPRRRAASSTSRARRRRPAAAGPPGPPVRSGNCTQYSRTGAMERGSRATTGQVGVDQVAIAGRAVGRAAGAPAAAARDADEAELAEHVPLLGVHHRPQQLERAPVGVGGAQRGLAHPRGQRARGPAAGVGGPSGTGHHGRQDPQGHHQDDHPEARHGRC